LVPRAAAPVRAGSIALRRRALVGVDDGDDHRVRILFPGELRVRDRALEDREERLRRLDRISRRPQAGLVCDPPPVRPHRHRLLEGRDVLQVFAGLLYRPPAQLPRELDRLLPRDREVSAIRSGHRLDLVFHRVPELRHPILTSASWPSSRRGCLGRRSTPPSGAPPRGLRACATSAVPPSRDRRPSSSPCVYLRRRFSFSRFGFGDIRPTFRPGGASYPTVDGLPTCWCDPPPWGWSTGFIATPRTLK